MIDNSWLLLIVTAFTLGIRHGFDLDHLATIDSITRTIRDNVSLAKRVGLLFSLGHGLVVTLISLIIVSGFMQSHIPPWLDTFGHWVSVIFLFLFGSLSLWNVFRRPTLSHPPYFLAHFLAQKLAHKKITSPMIMSIGALFAFSFDTFSQVALFSLAGSLVAGWSFAVVLSLFFMVGMMLSDGLNGLFVSIIIQRADTASLILSRSLGILISLFSFVIGILSLIRMA